MDWSLCDKNADLLAFARNVIALRKKHPVFRRRRFFDGKPIRSGGQVRDIAWLTPSGQEMTSKDWDNGFGKCIAVFLNGQAILEPDSRGDRITDDSFLLCFNADDQPQKFVMPQGEYAQEWTAALNSTESTGEFDLVVKAGEAISLRERSVLVLRKTA
jgi:glycogen operon protein